MRSSSAPTRTQFLKGTFPDGVPPLWCPPLTHYDGNGAIDASRMAAHLRHLSQYVRTFLIPGSTGDGWELTKAERRQLLALALEQAQKLNLRLLIGTLHPKTSETVALIHEDLDWLKSLSGERDNLQALRKMRVCGFTVCSPRGAELSQTEIGSALDSVLTLGLPTALYQLPQVTQNEIGPALAARLATRHQNFIFFKDTSGTDAVAHSGKTLKSVFTARGAEGDYARWLKGAGGWYDGFLLASANCFARELRQIIADTSAGRLESARQLSDRITAAVTETMKLAADLPDGNAFANANKAIDHFFAHGPEAVNVPPPRLHAGSSLPVELIRSTQKILMGQNLLLAKGYLQ